MEKRGELAGKKSVRAEGNAKVAERKGPFNKPRV
jgi:hypothetical protein